MSSYKYKCRECSTQFDNFAYCPKCQSTNITPNNKTIGKARFGMHITKTLPNKNKRMDAIKDSVLIFASVLALAAVTYAVK